MEEPRVNAILLECDQCSFKHDVEKVMDVHIQIHTKTSFRFGCPYCKFDSNYRASVKCHINGKHSKIKRILHCPYCDFKTAYQIDPHIELMHKDLLKVCDFCEYSSTDTLEIMEHVNVNHIKESLYKCWDCQYETTALSNLNSHVQNRHAEKLFRCRFCEYSSSRKHDVKIHENGIHIRDTIFKCSHCDFETTWRRKLTNHFETKHRGEEPKIIVKKES